MFYFVHLKNITTPYVYIYIIYIIAYTIILHNIQNISSISYFLINIYQLYNI